MFALIVALALILCAYLFTKNRFKYWKIRGVQTLEHQNIIFGDISKPICGKENFIITVDKAYYEFKSRGCKFGGIYCLNNPMLLIVDPEIGKLILATDADYFLDRGIAYDEEKHPISAHIFNLAGDEWRFIRRKLTPTFTTGKLKTMFWIIEKKFDKLCEVLEKRSGDDVCLIDLIERTGMDIIGQAAFGLNCNALENEMSPFHEVTAKIFKPSLSHLIYTSFKHAFKNHANLALLVTDNPECNAFFIKIVRDTVKYRKENNIRVNDFLQLLIELMEPKDGEEGLTLNKITAQAFLFFVAAYETGARSLNMIMYELAKDKELQEDLRKEILELLAKNDGKFSYDILKSCKLLEVIVNENFRKNPPLVYLNRVCVRDYKIPGTSVVIEAGTPIILPVYSFQHDPENYHNPEVFDPSRFSKENEQNIKPFTFLTFGAGPRYCIGNRLAEFQLRTAVMKIIQNFEISLSPKTEEPLTFSPVTKNLLLTFEQKIYFNVKKIIH